MRPRSAVSWLADSGTRQAVEGSDFWRAGVCPTPESISAAIKAIPSGLIRTPPPPMACEARPASPDTADTDPENAGTRRPQGASTPNAFSAAERLAVVSRSDTVAKAVPQPEAKSEASVADDDCPGEYVNVWPPTLATSWQGSGELAARPLLRSAAADTMVKAIPGWMRASTSPPGGRGRLSFSCPAIATMCPDAASTATMPAETGRCARDLLAAAWI